jgi:hypothetical protein
VSGAFGVLVASSLATVVRLFCFKTFTLHAPSMVEEVRLRPASGIALLWPPFYAKFRLDAMSVKKQAFL